MKHLKCLLMAGLCLTMLTACLDSEKTITADDLPAAAKTYVQQNYPDNKILLVKKEVDDLVTTYEVTLSDGMKLEFDSEGNLHDVDFND